jgi:signal transduction histidine kinase
MNVPTSTLPSFPFSLLQIGDDRNFARAISEAALLLNPAPEILRYPDLLAAMKAVTSNQRQLVALCGQDDATLAQAIAVLDDALLPRWAVVVFGSSRTLAPDAVFVGAAEFWTAPIVAQLFRHSLSTLELRRENARLRNEFATYGHRVSHDMRTPLGGVLTTTEMMREILAENAPTNVALTEPIIDSADGLVKLIDRISFLAKSIAKREPAELLDMGSVFWNAFEKLESQILRHGAKITHPQIWPKVSGHQSALEMVWRNLISNALEHGGPSVRMEAGWTEVEGGNRFWLRDSGTVPVEKRAFLFFPFYRMHESGAPRGLGLPIVRRLVELDGGTCAFEESTAGGSCFSFFLPELVGKAQ